MRKMAEYPYPTDVVNTVGPAVQLFERGYLHSAESYIASLGLWLLSQVEANALPREKADQIFTFLDVYLTEHHGDLTLSEEAQELIFEGELFHHYGEPMGPDPKRFEMLASEILRRTERVFA